jgi:hypothetical protein
MKILKKIILINQIFLVVCYFFFNVASRIIFSWFIIIANNLKLCNWKLVINIVIINDFISIKIWLIIIVEIFFIKDSEDEIKMNIYLFILATTYIDKEEDKKL